MTRLGSWPGGDAAPATAPAASGDNGGDPSESDDPGDDGGVLAGLRATGRLQEVVWETLGCQQERERTEDTAMMAAEMETIAAARECLEPKSIFLYNTLLTISAVIMHCLSVNSSDEYLTKSSIANNNMSVCNHLIMMKYATDKICQCQLCWL
jgi:hypothetical protein